MRVRSSSGFNRVIGDAWSAADGIGDRPDGDAAQIAQACLEMVPPRTIVRQFRSTDAGPPPVSTGQLGMIMDGSSLCLRTCLCPTRIIIA